MTLQAWCNGYEVVAAHSKEEARGVLRGSGASGHGPTFEQDEIEGDGWRTLPPDKLVRSDDVEAQPCGTVAQILAESPEPRHLWSVPQ